MIDPEMGIYVGKQRIEKWAHFPTFESGNGFSLSGVLVRVFYCFDMPSELQVRMLADTTQAPDQKVAQLISASIYSYTSLIQYLPQHMICALWPRRRLVNEGRHRF